MFYSRLDFLRAFLGFRIFHLVAANPNPQEAIVGNKAGAVTSEVKKCSQIGADLIRIGGSAADAMVGAVICVGVIGMYHSGIAGGGFMLVRDPQSRDPQWKYKVIDFRETAPAASKLDMFAKDPNLAKFGGLASGIPGELRGLQVLHKKHGKLPWAKLFEASIKLARDGFPISHDMLDYRKAFLADTTFLLHDHCYAQDFAPNGKLHALGEKMTRKRYAETLAQIAKHGANAFYTGEIAQSTVNTLKKANGIITMDDLKNYKVELRAPLQIEVNGYKLSTCPAPTSGAVLLGVLKTTEGYPKTTVPNQASLDLHRLDESLRFAYGRRAKLGDPKFQPANFKTYEKSLISQAIAASTRKLISDKKTQDVRIYNPPGLEIKDMKGTSHMVAADASGLVISLTTTINLIWGSHVCDLKTGILMNNNMADFSTPGQVGSFGFLPASANFIKPGKRPMSSAAPVIIDNEQGVFHTAVGSAGGSLIISTLAQIVQHVIRGHKSLAMAMRAPRFHDQLIPNQINYEPDYDPSMITALKDLGHVMVSGMQRSSAHALQRLADGTFVAVSDPRQASAGGATA